MREKSQRLKDAEKIVALKGLLAQSDEQAKYWNNKWIESERSRGPAMADSLERGKLEKQLRIIGHIVAGRKDEAITEILTPMPMSFSIQVAYADDKTRMSAEDETLEKLKNVLAEALKGIKIKREEAKKSGWTAKSDGEKIVAEYKK